MSGPGRLDAELVRRGLARSRGHARELIDAGLVSVAGRTARKPSTPVAVAGRQGVRQPRPPKGEPAA